MTCIDSKRQYFSLFDDLLIIRDFPDHATFREKGAKLACVDKLGDFLNLTLCNKANFDPLQRVKYDCFEKM